MATGYQLWQNEILEEFGMKLSATSVRGANIKAALEALLPLTTPIRTRFVFLGTNSKWTVFFDNGPQGTDAGSAMSVMARRLNCEALRVVHVEQTLSENSDKHAKGRYGATILEVYATDGATRRTVYTANDGGKWKFGQSGAPYVFENQEAYKRRKVRERFTGPMLVDYLAKLGADPFNECWYTGEAVALKKEGALPANLVEHSLEACR